MFSEITKKYLAKTLRSCNYVYQNPILWNEENCEFVLDNSLSYKRHAQFSFIFDIFVVFVVGFAAFFNYIHNLSYNFTLIILLCLAPVIENVLIDIHAAFTKEISLQLLNSLYKLITEKKDGTDNLITAKEAAGIDATIHGLYILGFSSMGVLTLLIIILFMTDLHLLSVQMNASAFGMVGLECPYWFPFLCTTVEEFVFAFHMYLSTQKWYNIFIQYTLCLYYTSLRLSHCETVETYNTLYIFVNIFNKVFAFHLIGLTVVVNIVVSFASTLSLMEGISVLSLILLSLSLALLAALNLMLSLSKTVFVSSEETLHKLRVKYQRHAHLRHRRVLGLRLCRIYCGSHYFVDREMLCTINEAIPNNTVNNTLMLKN